jgi:NitT/TauT family transport system permease protein
MAMILLQPGKPKRAFAGPASIGIEVFVLLGIASIFGGLILIGGRAVAPMPQKFSIDLRLRYLPLYTSFTLLRGLAAYLLSLVFTLVYGIIAAHNRRAEKVMVPALDILQSLPVLTFLPVLVTFFVGLFPSRQIGLELACVVMIFTAQAWNMCFSFFGSVRGIPPSLREVTQIQHLNSWQVFRLLEVPASMIGLVWNSMMSMAGGWFFIALAETFNGYILPGLGSYMQAAQNAYGTAPDAAARHIEVVHQVAAVVAMVIMIVGLDQLLWRPIVAWSERYKLEDVSAAETPKSWVLELLNRSRLIVWLNYLLAGPRRSRPERKTPTLAEQEHRRQLLGTLQKVAAVIVLAGLAVGFAWGMWALFQLLRQVPFLDRSLDAAHPYDWRYILLALLSSFVRVTVALVVGAAWTLPVGILIGLSPRWSQRLQPVVQVVSSFPAPMLFPWVVALLAIMHVPFSIGCISLLLLGTQWYVLFNVVAGAMAIPSDLREAARVYRLGRWFTWRKLYIPAVFPYLVTGLVTATGGAWNATIVAEFFTLGGPVRSTFGLGTIIDLASDTTNPNHAILAAAAITMAVFVVTINRIVWKPLYRIAEQRYSLNI